MKLSIITINFNNLEGLKKTMESVFMQTNQEFEYIVIDGASTDGSAKYIYENADHLTYWVSEKDTGIYNAMNKGVRAAKGEYVLMLNSGDYLVNEEVVNLILPLLDGIDVIQGNVVIDKNGKSIICRGYGHSDISMIDVYHNHFLHQATFTKKDVFEQYGYFDESYRINGDTVFFAKTLGFGNATFKYIDVNIAYYDMNGISADPNHKWVLLREEEDLRYEQMYSDRLRAFLQESEIKINFYNDLHKDKLIWCMALGLRHLVNILRK